MPLIGFSGIHSNLVSGFRGVKMQLKVLFEMAFKLEIYNMAEVQFKKTKTI